MVQNINNVKPKIRVGLNEGPREKGETRDFGATLNSLRSQDKGAFSNKVGGIENSDLSGIKNGAMTSENLVKEIIQNLDAGHKRIEGILKLSMRGLRLSQQELLTLQMRVYKFTQEVELISKIVEKGTSGVKQMVNTQI